MDEPNERFDAATLAVETLVGKECWSFSAGAGTGSHLSLSFGRRLLRSTPLKNPNLSEEARRFDAEIALHITCAWRLDDSDQVLCGAWDDNRSDGPMLRGLKQLVGTKASRVTVRQPALDLELVFDNQLVLSVFCDQVNDLDCEDNYSISLSRRVLVVGCRSKVSVEPRSAP